MQIDNLIKRVLSGQVRIPGFQRGYVWDPQRAALLMDTIFKGYPYGTILMWRSSERLLTEKQLGGFVLPEPSKGYPLDYVLDGQQRITSIFRTFQTSVTAPEEDPELWLPIYYDFEAVADVQESQFVALPEVDVDPEHHFPLSSFFDPVVFANRYSLLADDRQREIAQVQSKFSGTLIPVQTFETDDRASVAIVFERVNRMGVELDLFQLLTAWTWSEEFELPQKFEELNEVLEDFGFRGIGANGDLMMKCCAAILRGNPEPSSLMDVNGEEVRSKFDLIAKSMKRAVDFLRTNLRLFDIRFLPYSSQLIPLAAYFAEKKANASVSKEHRLALLRWFWRSSFSHRYSGNPKRNIAIDVEEAVKLCRGESSSLGATPVSVNESFYLSKGFNLNTVATKTFVLQLAQHCPLTFMDGGEVDLGRALAEPSRREFHHCYPKHYLSTNGIEANSSRINDLVNRAFLKRAENNEISSRAPSEYRGLMAENIDSILESQLLPKEMFDDDWQKFRRLRAEMLVGDARRLLAEGESLTLVG
ncbi:GmrSD restriction endonuclease domain-containing protein [Actinomyces oris]